MPRAPGGSDSSQRSIGLDRNRPTVGFRLSIGPNAPGPDPIVADPVARAAAIFGLVGVAVIHFAQVVATIDQTPYLGAMFVLFTVACAAMAGRLLDRATGLLWVAVAMVNALAIAGYVFTRVFSTFIDHQDVGNWSEMLGLAALLVEGLIVMLSVRQIRAARLRDVMAPAARPRSRRTVRPGSTTTSLHRARRTG